MDIIQIHEPYICGKCHHIGIMSYRLLIYIVYSHILYRMPSITTTGISFRVHQNDYDTKSRWRDTKNARENGGVARENGGVARENGGVARKKSHSVTAVSFTLCFLHFFCGVLQCTCTCPLVYHCRLSQHLSQLC